MGADTEASDRTLEFAHGWTVDTDQLLREIGLRFKRLVNAASHLRFLVLADLLFNFLFVTAEKCPSVSQVFGAQIWVAAE